MLKLFNFAAHEEEAMTGPARRSERRRWALRCVVNAMIFTFLIGFNFLISGWADFIYI